MDFQRARNDEQRSERRRAILHSAAEMLTEMPVAALSLNELSRRVGLAKSNVMRYFESREAILLEMLNTELQSWAEQLTLPATGGADSPEQLRAVANAFAASMDERHTMCDLISAQASVLERNVSAEVALRHKVGVGTSVALIVEKLRAALPELTMEEIFEIVAGALILASGAWPQSHPSEAILEVYREHPELAARQSTFTEIIGRYIEITTLGLLARRA